MGGGNSKFTPGFKPSDGRSPKEQKCYSTILEAYKTAVEYVTEKKQTKRSYCIVGEGNMVTFWREDEDVTLSVQPESTKSFFMVYHDDLNIKFPPDVDASKITATIGDP